MSLICTLKDLLQAISKQLPEPSLRWPSVESSQDYLLTINPKTINFADDILCMY